MKKCLLATLVGCALFSASSHADTIAGVYAGAQVWQTDTTGGFADSSSTADFNFDDETNTALYVAFEHPLPFVPNVKIGHTTLDNSGTTTLNTNFTFDGDLYTADSQVDTIVELDATDIIRSEEHTCELQSPVLSRMPSSA